MPARTATRTCTAATRRPRPTSGDEEGAMKRTFLVAATLALVLPVTAGAQEFQHVSMTLGAWQKDFDTNSSKFLEYRDIPQGMVLPAFQFKGRKGSFRFDLQGKDVTQQDQQYLLRLEDGSFRLRGAYTGIPHNFGNGGKSLLSRSEE